MTDWREQAYEDQYWAEFQAVRGWTPATAELFLRAVDMVTAPRAQAGAQVRETLTANTKGS